MTRLSLPKPCCRQARTHTITHARTRARARSPPPPQAFNAITLAVISGAIVERMTLPAFCLFSMVWTLLVYCPLAHWIFFPGGFLAQVRDAANHSHNEQDPSAPATCSAGSTARLSRVRQPRAQWLTSQIGCVCARNTGPPFDLFIPLTTTQPCPPTLNHPTLTTPLTQWGVLDFAGGLVVETASGVSGFVLAFWVGPSGIKAAQPRRAHNVPYSLLGAGFLLIGWLGFNAGSVRATVRCSSAVWLRVRATQRARRMFMK